MQCRTPIDEPAFGVLMCSLQLLNSMWNGIYFLKLLERIHSANVYYGSSRNNLTTANTMATINSYTLFATIVETNMCHFVVGPRSTRMRRIAYSSIQLPIYKSDACHTQTHQTHFTPAVFRGLRKMLQKRVSLHLPSL